MHSISIKFKPSVSQNDVWQYFYTVLGQMKENGQINGRELNPYINNNTIAANIWTFTEDALAESNHNKYVKLAIENLEQLAGYKLQTKFLGYGEEEQENICTCKKHKYLVLYYYGDFSPIRCGNCQKFVPLFKLPKLHDDRIWDITGWVSSYKACLTLDLNCGTGEQWAMKQQCDYNSGLSIQGRKIAAKITEIAGVKCYYFINNFAKKSKISNAERPCPSCGGEWHLKKEIFGYFKHKCDTCLLMSAYSNYHK